MALLTTGSGAEAGPSPRTHDAGCRVETVHGSHLNVGAAESLKSARGRDLVEEMETPPVSARSPRAPRSPAGDSDTDTQTCTEDAPDETLEPLLQDNEDRFCFLPIQCVGMARVATGSSAAQHHGSRGAGHEEVLAGTAWHNWAAQMPTRLTWCHACALQASRHVRILQKGSGQLLDGGGGRFVPRRSRLEKSHQCVCAELRVFGRCGIARTHVCSGGADMLMHR